jgi:glycosyltransferase involved in cell wall biosynthesis
MTQQLPTSDPHALDLTVPVVPVVPVGPPGPSPGKAPVARRTTADRQPSAAEEIEARLAELEELAAAMEALDSEPEPPPAPLKLPADFRLSIVVPVYNERATIRAILAKLLQLDLPTQIIVVDDGSSDGTQDELRRLQGLPGLQIILKRVNEGKGAALRTGFQHVTGSVVLVQDADLEYDPRDIPHLLAPIVSGEVDVVYGSRFLEERWSGSSAIHRLGNRLLTMASNLTTGLRLTDMETCYKLFRADVLPELTVRQDRFGFEPEVTAKLARRGLRFGEVPIRYHARDWSDGKKIGLRDALNAFYCIARYAWRD